MTDYRDFPRIPRRQYRCRNLTAFVVGMVILAVFGIVGTIEYRAEQENRTPLYCGACHNRHAAMTEYFRQAGSKTPEMMAMAVLSTNSPRLLAAIAKVETGGNPQVRRAGYKKKYSGAFQTHPMWGKVTSNVTEQALIAEFALDTHVGEEKNIIRGLNAYGGEKDKSHGKYAFNVLKELSNVP